MREGLSKMRGFRLGLFSGVKGGCRGCILIWSNDGGRGGVGPGGPGGALGRELGRSGVWPDPWSLLVLWIPLKGSLLWILTYMDPQDPILYFSSAPFANRRR